MTRVHRGVIAGVTTAVLLSGCTTSSATSGAPLPSAPVRATSDAASTPPKSTVLIWSFSAYSTTTVHRLSAALGHHFTPVHVGLLPLASGRPHYPEIPIETIGVEPRHFAAAMGSPALVGQLQHGVVLSRAEARLRHAQAGSRLRLVGGRRLRVAAVVPDVVIGGYEVAMRMKPARRLGVHLTEYALDAQVQSLRHVKAVVHRVLGSEPTRVRRAGVRPYLRHGDDVAPQVAIKEKFGEFAMRASSGSLRLRPAWVHRHIVTTSVPVIGRVTCNRALIPDLRAVMRELQRRGLAGLVHDYDGCFVARPIRGSASELSRHTWGAAIDINASSNSLGSRGHQDPRLVAAFAHHHFTWGGHWVTRRDPNHFEWVGDVAAYGG
jgi:D-alanyl-D-alanine carboxypeptidase-like protein